MPNFGEVCGNQIPFLELLANPLAEGAVLRGMDTAQPRARCLWWGDFKDQESLGWYETEKQSPGVKNGVVCCLLWSVRFIRRMHSLVSAAGTLQICSRRLLPLLKHIGVGCAAQQHERRSRKDAEDGNTTRVAREQPPPSRCHRAGPVSLSER